MDKAGWCIYDDGKIYIRVVYATEAEAVRELADLLKPYPVGHEWRMRLRTKFCDRAYLYKRGEAMYGWQVRRDKIYGMQQIPKEYEQKIIRLVKKLHNTGESVAKILEELESQGKTPRHGVTWTKDLVQQLLDVVIAS